MINFAPMKSANKPKERLILVGSLKTRQRLVCIGAGTRRSATYLPEGGDVSKIPIGRNSEPGC